VEATLGRELDLVAVVEDLHAGWFQLTGKPAQRQPHLRDGRVGRLREPTGRTAQV
jgi:hypothetical protein